MTGGERRVLAELTAGLGGTCRLAAAALLGCALLVLLGALLSLVGALIR
jgi:hypothetical protein